MSERNEAVRALYTPTEPLGPPVAGETADRDKLKLLFDKENKLVSQLNHEKSLVIGRKGSGKTTLLMSVQLMEPDAQVFYLPSGEYSDIFARVAQEIDELSKGVAFVEQVGRLWDFVLWGVVMGRVVRLGGQSQLAEYCKTLRIDDAQHPYLSISNMLQEVRKFPPEDWPIPEKIAYKSIGGISFLQAKQLALEVLEKARVRVYILMDSLEDFKLHIPSYNLAIAGLLRCLGEFNERRSGRVILRCCVPAENYHAYTELSSNPLKDFRDGLLLHWAAGELIHLSAMRYSAYLREYHTAFFEGQIADLKLDRRHNLKKFWSLVFSGEVVSRLGQAEKPMAYILRHTQLLPRHFIFYLNEIISTSIKQHGLAYGIPGEVVRDGVRRTEPLVSQQILQAYGSEYKDPRRACELTLKELKTVFDWTDFDKVAARVTNRGIRGVSDRTELMTVLTEIGAIGRVVNDGERYWEGVFEYMVPHKLVFSDRDRFCIHPVFSEVFSVDVNYPEVKAVYTYWSGITDDDIKDWM